MTQSGKPVLAQYRIKQAKERLKAAELLCKSKSYRDSLSRSYYAMLQAARALLATKQLDSQKHSGVISLFNLHFVKEGIVDRSLGRLFAEAKGMREESDYADYVSFTQEDAQDQIKHAEFFIQEVLKVLKE